MLAPLIQKLSLVWIGFTTVLLAHYIVHTLGTHRTLRKIPGPAVSTLLWGEEWDLFHSKPGSLYVNWHGRFGRVVSFTGAFGHQILSITDPRAIHFILGEGAYQFPKPAGVRAWFKATLGEGILWVEGKVEHEFQRRLLVPALNQTSVRGLTSIFLETSLYMADQWTKLLENHETDQLEIEITYWAGRFALDTIGRAAFGHDFNCLSGDPHELAEALDGLTNNEHRPSSFYMRALFWIFPSILFIGKKGQMIREVKRRLGSEAKRMWSDTKTLQDSGNQTLMANMLRCDDSSQMTEEEVVSQMRTVISAGYETVSAIVAWMLFEISIHPKFQEQLRLEIASIPEPTFDQLNTKFPLLDAALKETLRLHPAILENHHEVFVSPSTSNDKHFYLSTQAAQTITVPLSEPLAETGEMRLVVPAGTLISIPVNVLQTDKEIWGDDADEFQPSRWLEGGKGVATLPKGRELFAFSAGPRSCIGKSFAMAEIKVGFSHKIHAKLTVMQALMITLLQRFSFQCKHEIEPFQSFVIRPRVKGENASSLPLLVTRL
ncbi:hypothetical protein CVT24_004291 [Panaeolus cyanescens]|uniref:Cytochrome P450 n=1 Tax=Panaeolus cyanescens TaxID=181874 RepID=A0A409VA54_9AGAR|nr:hypothetical protein CVT24_004291 [Panaeolus cyanescens]